MPEHHRKGKGQPNRYEQGFYQRTKTDVFKAWEFYTSIEMGPTSRSDCPLPTCFKNLLGKKRPKDALALYWGTWSDPPACELKSIGLRGKLWALRLLERYFTAVPTDTRPLVTQIFSKSRLDGKDQYAEETRWLLSDVQKREIPNAASFDAIKNAVIYYYSDWLFEKFEAEGNPSDFTSLQIKAIITSTLDEACSGINECHDALVSKLKINNEFKTNVDVPPFPEIVQMINEDFNRSFFNKIRATKLHWFDQIFRDQLEGDTANYDFILPDEQLNGHARQVPFRGEDNPQIYPDKIREKLGLLRTEQPILDLQGPPHCGKKAVVTKLLAELTRLSEGRTTVLAIGNPGERTHRFLPTLALSARSRSHTDLALHVRAFLLMLDETRRDVEPHEFSHYLDELTAQQRQVGSNISIDKSLAEIDRLSAENPAFFILTDVEGYEKDSISKILMDYDISRMLHILRKNPLNRVLITTDKEFPYTSSDLSSWELGPIDSLVLPTPPFERITSYWRRISDEAEKKTLHDIFDDLVSRPKLRTAKMDGVLLIMAASNLQLCLNESVDDQFLESTKAAIAQYLNAELDDHLSAELFEGFLKVIDDLGMMPIVALVLSSEDGVLESTIYESLKRWREAFEDEITSSDLNNFRGALDYISSLASGFLLRSLVPTKIDPDEYGLREFRWSVTDLIDGDVFEPSTRAAITDMTLWKFDSAVRVGLIRALQNNDRYAGILRKCNRLIAIAARRRAQHKKLSSQSPQPIRPDQDSARDIQCFVSLIASFEERDLESVQKYNGALRAGSEAVFSLGDQFCPRTALAFSIKCLLCEDIDRGEDHQLGMVTDQDDLRLRLYLLPFFPPGFQYEWNMEDLMRGAKDRFRLPDKIPEYLIANLGYEVVASMLSTIAISAYFATNVTVIEWAFARSRDLVSAYASYMKIEQAEAEALLLKAICRVWFAKIDISIDKGAFDRGETGDLKTKDFIVDDLLERSVFENQSLEYLEKFGSDTPKAAGISSTELEVIKIWLRLQFRLAELLTKSGDEKGGQALALRLYKIDGIVSNVFHLAEPLIFSGRTARRYIRMILGAPLSDKWSAGSVGVDDFTRARNLIEINTARLRKFSGVDRVGVLIDLARRHIYDEGEIRIAMGYLEKASQQVRTGRISAIGKCELWLMVASIRIAACENAAFLEEEKIAAQKLLKRAETNVERLKRIATHSGFLPMQHVATFLECYIYCLRIENKEIPPSKHIEKKIEALADAAISMEQLNDSSYQHAMRDLNERLSELWY